MRHTLSLAGNRKLKVMPCTWLPSAKPGRTFEAESLLPQEEGGGEVPQGGAVRCLKRRICDAVFKSFMADLEGPSCSAA